MSAHVGITSTGGLTLPSGAIAEEVQITASVGTSKVIGQTGEYALGAMLQTVKTEVRLTGTGKAATIGAAGAIGTPSTMTVIEAEQNEVVSGRATFTTSAAGHAAFTDGVGGGGGGDSSIDDTTLTLVSIDFTMAQTARSTIKIADKVLTGAGGTPAARALVTKEGSFSVTFLGDQPAINLGTAGAAIGTMSGGVTLVPKIVTTQKAADWNGGSYDGEWLPTATAG